jgi:hypothetical protein
MTNEDFKNILLFPNDEKQICSQLNHTICTSCKILIFTCRPLSLFRGSPSGFLIVHITYTDSTENTHSKSNITFHRNTRRASAHIPYHMYTFVLIRLLHLNMRHMNAFCWRTHTPILTRMQNQTGSKGNSNQVHH